MSALSVLWISLVYQQMHFFIFLIIFTFLFLLFLRNFNFILFQFYVLVTRYPGDVFSYFFANDSFLTRFCCFLLRNTKTFLGLFIVASVVFWSSNKSNQRQQSERLKSRHLLTAKLVTPFASHRSLCIVLI